MSVLGRLAPDVDWQLMRVSVVLVPTPLETRGCEPPTLDHVAKSTVLLVAAREARLVAPGPRLRDQRQESGRQVVHPSLHNRHTPIRHVTACCDDPVIEVMAANATGMRGKRPRYQELIAPNGSPNGSRPNR